MSTSPEVFARSGLRLPGDLAMWFFILVELSVFAIFILAFAVTQWLSPELFAQSRAELDSSMGLALTLSLLTSGLDRKSTRLNSSHVKISYAVFCLKKKTSSSATSVLASAPLG